MKSKVLAREMTVAKNYKEHIGAFKPGRHSSALLSRNKLLNERLVKAEKESVSKTSEREFYFVSGRKSLTNITGTTSGKNIELASLAKKGKCT